jgi:TonB-linked SusC/RagA family outer membrane protein
MYNFYKQKLCTPTGYVAKFLLIMRLTTLILFTAIMQVSAGSFAQRITLSEKNAALVAVFNKISNQTGFDFIVTSDVLKQARPVNITVNNQDMSEVLHKIFEGQPLSFSIKDRIVVVSKKEKTVVDQVLNYLSAYTINGIVTNERGEPLAGANVWIMGQNRGYGTAENGRFSLNGMLGNEILITTYLGYKTDTLQLNGQRNVNIRMVPMAARLAEVSIVNTGYQKLNKEQVTGAYGKPDMEIFNNRVATTDIISRLDGLVAGVTVKAGPGGAGANRYGTGTNQQSIIRGVSSVGLPSEPLYVIDGIQVPNLSNLNPNDIADITVLKDAAASAIYGAKAANGVIVIITKTGKKDQKVHINYSGALTMRGKPRLKKGYYMNSAQYIQTAKELFDPVTYPISQLSASFITPHEQILYNLYQKSITQAQADKSLDSLSRIDNRSQINDLFFRNAFSTNNTVSASGGSRVYSVYSSLSHVKNQSNTPGEVNNSYLISLNQSINPASWLTIGLNTALNNNISQNKKPITVGTAFLPYQLFADQNGTPLPLNYMTGLSAARQADYQLRSRINLDYIPLEEADKGYSKSNLLNVNTTANVEIRFWKGLSFQGTYGYQRATGTTTDYDDHSSLSRRKELLNFTVAATPATVPVYYLPTTGGRYSTVDRTGQNWTLRNQLVFNTALRAGRDRLNIQIGQEALEQSTVLNTSVLRGYDDVLKTYSLLDYVTLAKPLFGAIGSGYSMFSEKPFTRMAEKSRFKSYFGLFNYAMNDKYMLDASVRADKSSLFASDESAQNKPSFSIGAKWQLSKEGWFGQVRWIDNLGLRATYGITGNSPYVGAASTFDILSTGQDTNLGNYLSVNSPANNKLSWEATHTWNFGLDFALLHGRLNGNTEVYFKNTTDLIGQVAYNPLTGTESTRGNIGNIKNSGIELSLNSRNIIGSGFNWSSGFVFSYNHNKLGSYSKPLQMLENASSVVSSTYRIGYSRPAVFAYKYAGLDQFGDPQIQKADGSITKDIDAATPEDLVFMGTSQPKFNGGLSNTFRYRNISVSANLVYNLGAVMRKQVESNFSQRLTVSSFSDGNRLADFANRWKKPGDEKFTNIPSYEGNPGLNYSRRNLSYYSFADINVISASYLKLRDVTVAYDLPDALMRRLHLQKISLFAQTGNFLIWKANKEGIDPEYSGDSLANHIYSLGLNVSF